MSVHIRPATADDLSAVHALVVELAIFEREPTAVTRTLGDYQRDFTQGWFQCDVACIDDIIVGTAISCRAYSTWKGPTLYLEDLIVADAHRGLGIGSQLLEAFFTRARISGAVLCRWQALNWNERAIRFYEQRGATADGGWVNLKCQP